jgi:hypothetical protein
VIRLLAVGAACSDASFRCQRQRVSGAFALLLSGAVGDQVVVVIPPARPALAAHDEVALKPSGHVPAVLDRPHPLAVQAARPPQRRSAPGGRHGHGTRTGNSGRSRMVDRRSLRIFSIRPARSSWRVDGGAAI